jgi:hypothetical protein
MKAFFLSFFHLHQCSLRSLADFSFRKGKETDRRQRKEKVYARGE